MQQLCRFEPGDIGGRTQVFEHEGSVYEMGASIIHGQNRYFRCISPFMLPQCQQTGVLYMPLSLLPLPALTHADRVHK